MIQDQQSEKIKDKKSIQTLIPQDKDEFHKTKEQETKFEEESQDKQENILRS